jgi:hypothetical protein
MAKMIQIRNVPPEMHRELVRRAKRSGMSLSDYLKAELARIVGVPTLDEILDRVSRRTPVNLDPPSAEIIREGRESR